MQELSLRSTRREEMINITRALESLVKENGWENGALLVFCPHTTAGLTINEAADPDVARDMTAYMGRLIPKDAGFSHAEGNSDAHIKTSLMGPYTMLIVDKGRIRLGTWQGVWFCEWDGPRRREFWAQFLPA